MSSNSTIKQWEARLKHSEEQVAALKTEVKRLKAPVCGGWKEFREDGHENYVTFLEPSQIRVVVCKSTVDENWFWTVWHECGALLASSKSNLPTLAEAQCLAMKAAEDWLKKEVKE